MNTIKLPHRYYVNNNNVATISHYFDTVSTHYNTSTFVIEDSMSEHHVRVESDISKEFNRKAEHMICDLMHVPCYTKSFKDVELHSSDTCELSKTSVVVIAVVNALVIVVTLLSVLL